MHPPAEAFNRELCTDVYWELFSPPGGANESPINAWSSSLLNAIRRGCLSFWWCAHRRMAFNREFCHDVYRELVRSRRGCRATFSCSPPDGANESPIDAWPSSLLNAIRRGCVLSFLSCTHRLKRSIGNCAPTSIGNLFALGAGVGRLFLVRHRVERTSSRSTQSRVPH